MYIRIEKRQSGEQNEHHGRNQIITPTLLQLVWRTILDCISTHTVLLTLLIHENGSVDVGMQKILHLKSSESL